MHAAKRILIGAALLSVWLAWAAAADTPVPAGAGKKPPPAPVKPVTETLWGRKVTDNYRYMEALDPATIAWMKAQGAYTRSVLDGDQTARTPEGRRREVHRQLRTDPRLRRDSAAARSTKSARRARTISI